MLIETADGPRIRVFGGFGDNRFRSDLADYDLHTKQWVVPVTGVVGPAARRGHAACSDKKGRMFVFGGVGMSGTLLDGLLCLEADSSSDSTVVHRWSTYDMHPTPDSWPSNSLFDYGAGDSVASTGVGRRDAYGGGGGGGSGGKTPDPQTPGEEAVPLLTGTLIDYPTSSTGMSSSSTAGSIDGEGCILGSSSGGSAFVSSLPRSPTAMVRATATAPTPAPTPSPAAAAAAATPAPTALSANTSTVDSDSPMSSPFVDTLHPPGLYDHSLCCDELSEAIYIAGGLSAGGTSDSSSVWKFCMKSRAWTVVSLLGCQGRSRHQAFLLTPFNMMVVGGTRGSSNTTFACALQVLDLENKAALVVKLYETAVDGTSSTPRIQSRCEEEASEASYDFDRRSWSKEGSSIAERRDFCLAAFPAADGDWKKTMVLLWGGQDSTGYCAPGVWVLHNFGPAVPSHDREHLDAGCGEDPASASRSAGGTPPASREKVATMLSKLGPVPALMAADADDGYSAATSSGVSSLDSAHRWSPQHDGTDASAGAAAVPPAAVPSGVLLLQQPRGGVSTIDGTVSDGSDAYASGSGDASGADSGSGHGFEPFPNLYGASGVGLIATRAPSNETVGSGSGGSDDDVGPSHENHEPGEGPWTREARISGNNTPQRPLGGFTQQGTASPLATHPTGTGGPAAAAADTGLPDARGASPTTPPRNPADNITAHPGNADGADIDQEASSTGVSTFATKLTTRLSMELGSQGAVRRGSAGADVLWSKGKLLGTGT